jgi:hypothetical protein
MNSNRIPLKADDLRAALAKAKDDKVKAEDARKASFLRALGDDALAFESELIAWIASRLHFMAKVLLTDTATFPAPWKHADKFRRRFRVSTFVSMYRLEDPHVFEQLGYAPGESPFTRICKLFQERGIQVADASDPSKGYGFWVKLSFS